MFKLVDIAGYIKVMDSTAWRTHWLDTQTHDVDRQSFAHFATEAYTEHAWREIERLHEEFERDLLLLKQGLYPPDIRVAQLALQAQEEHSEEPRPQPPHKVTGPLHVLVVLNIVPILSPRPRIVNGELLETHFDIDAASRTALERALELKFASEKVSVTAIAVAPGDATESLRRALALGANGAALIKTTDLPDNPHDSARLVADLMGQKQLPCDLVLCGDAIMAAVLAGNLGASHFSGVKEFVVNGDQTTIHLLKPVASITNDGPVVLAMTEGETDLDFHVDDYFKALNKPLEVIDALQLATAPRPGLRYQLPEKRRWKRSLNRHRVSRRPRAKDCRGRNRRARQRVVRGQSGIRREGKAAGTRCRRVPGDTRKTGRPRNRRRLRRGIGIAIPRAGAGRFRQARRAVGRGPRERPLDLLRKQPASVGRDAGRVARGASNDVERPVARRVGLRDWANELLAQFARTFPRVQACYNVADVAPANGALELVMPAFGGKVQRVATVSEITTHPLVMTVATGASGEPKVENDKQVSLVSLEFEYDPETDDLARALRAAHEETSVKSIADAEFIIDVGYAVRNQENFDLVIAPLKKRLEEIGLKNVLLGGTRKVVEELKLLAPDQQIGQTGTAVNPRMIISIGVSGAPQHVDYIGDRATIIAFNKDADAPLMTLNKRRARPKVVPVIGDLFETVPRFTAALKPHR